VNSYLSLYIIAIRCSTHMVYCCCVCSVRFLMTVQHLSSQVTLTFIIVAYFTVLKLFQGKLAIL